MFQVTLRKAKHVNQFETVVMSEQKFQLRIVSFCLFSWPIHSKNLSSLPTKDKLKLIILLLSSFFGLILFSSAEKL